MIALEVRRNGKRVCIAGADDLAVLSAHVTAVGKLGTKTVPARPDDTTGEIHYSVGGLTARPDPKKDVHLKGKSVAPLRVGDVIEVRVLETERVDRATSRTKAKRKRA
jgi:ATP-dependent Clp protease adapter protein ClpS